MAFGRLGLGFGRLGAGSGGGSFALSRPTLTDLTDATDTGVSTTDNITSAVAPEFSINWGANGILENDTIEVRDNGSLINTHTVTAGEEVSQNITLSLTLAEGVHSLTIRHVRGALTSNWSAAYSLTVDTTAPTLSSPAGAQLAQTTASLSVSTNENNGTLYYVVTTSVTAPSAAQVKAGQNNGGTAALYAGSQSISSTGSKTATATGVTVGTRYAYYMHEDLAGNQSSVSASSSWSQADITAPVLSSPTGTKTGSTTATLGVTTDEGNGTLYGVLTLTSTPPTAAQIAAGQNAAGASAAYSFNQAVSGSGAQTKSATGLSASTTYYAHYVQDDAASNRSNVVSASSFTTDAGSLSITATATKTDTGGGTTVNYGSNSVGSQNANRVIVVAIWARMGATASVSSVSIGGNAASQVSGAAAGSAGSCCTDIWYIADSSSNTSETISVTYNGSTLESAIEVYSVITSTPTPSGGNSSASASATARNANLAIPSGGGLIGIVGITANPGGAAFTWSTSGSTIVEDADQSSGSARWFSAAHDTSDAGTTPTITATYTGGGGATNISLSLAAWSP